MEVAKKRNRNSIDDPDIADVNTTSDVSSPQINYSNVNIDTYDQLDENLIGQCGAASAIAKSGILASVSSEACFSPTAGASEQLKTPDHDHQLQDLASRDNFKQDQHLQDEIVTEAHPEEMQYLTTDTCLADYPRTDQSLHYQNV